MNVGAAEFFGTHHLTGRGLHQWRPAEEDGALIAHDDAFVGHRRDVGAAGGTGSHHDGDLWNALRGEVRLIVEDTAEVPLVRKDLVLLRQEGAAGIHHVDAGQIILPSDILRAQMLFHGHRIVGAALDGRIIGDNHALPSRDSPDTGDDARRVHVAAIKAVRRQRRQLKKGRPRIDQQIDSVSGQHLAARQMFGARGLAATARDRAELLLQLGDERTHRRNILLKIL